MQYLLVALGGGIGSALRYGVSIALPSKQFPAATFLVNVVGCFAIGIVMALFAKQQIGFNWKILLAAGICGGFTTFSAFAWENMQLLQQGKAGMALFYIFSSLAAGLIAAWLGFKIFNT